MTARATAPELAAQVRSIVADHRGERGALLPILHAVQAELGCIDPSVVPVIADELNLSRADVHGVISFYRDVRTRPPGRVQVRVCRAEACQSVGAERLAADAHLAGSERVPLGGVGD
jgi:formate dehydrogenase subunit gamma